MIIKSSDTMHIISALLNDVKMMVSSTGKKLGTCFNVKDKMVSTMNMILCIMLSAQRNLVQMVM